MRAGEAITSSTISEDALYPVFGGNGVRGYTDRYTHDGWFVLIGRQGAHCGNVHLAAGRFWASEHAIVCSVTGSDPRWLRYTVHSMNLNQYSVSAAQPGIAVERIRDLSVRVPPLEVQRAIADFLDRKTVALDALIDKKERLVALLQEKRQALITQAVTKGLDPNVPMKDSGIEWLGEIPAHWDCAPLYSRYEVQLGKMLDGKRSTGDDLRPYLRNANVSWEGIDVEDVKEMDFDAADRAKYRLRPGDLLVCEGGANINVVGKSAIWEGQIDECYYQKALHRVRPTRSREQPRFLLYALYAAMKQGVFIAESNPNTVFHLTAEKLRRHRFPFPPSAEQQSIVDALVTRTANLDRLSERTRTTVDRLREYRQALITAAVTGQLEVLP
jgi:type I restriction enzyme S subunit